MLLKVLIIIGILGWSDASQRVTPTQMRNLSRDLERVDTNSVGNLIRTSAQGKTTSTATNDAAPNKLFSSVPQSALNKTTIALLRTLADNYEANVNTRETTTQAETNEENAFLDAVVATPVMQRVATFLQQKSLISKSLKEVLKEIWFTKYPRSRNRRNLSSSGFEHVFVGEIKGTAVSGFHNWLSFYKEETEGDVDYKGWMQTIGLGKTGKALSFRFTWSNGSKKSYGSMILGISPELEMGLYTVCFFTRPNSNCPVQLNNRRFNIKIFTSNYNGKTLVGTAYPNI